MHSIICPLAMSNSTRTLAGQFLAEHIYIINPRIAVIWYSRRLLLQAYQQIN